MTDKPIKIEFAPGAFDTFDGTQEELDELVAEIKRMFESGEIMEKSTPVDFDALVEEDPEFAMAIARQLGPDEDTDHRNLQ